MSEPDNNNDSEAERSLQALFRLASHREQPPQEDERKIRGAIHAEWKALARQRQRSRQKIGWALAASIVLALFLSGRFLQVSDIPAVPRLAATLERQSGQVTRSRSGPDAQLAAGYTGQDLFTGDTIATGTDAALALAWSAGGSLRLDKATRVVLTSATEIELQAGRIYFDSLPNTARHATAASLTVKTEVGVLHHLGTQFTAGVFDHTLIVSVREGSVSITGERYSRMARVGQQLEIRADGDYHVAAQAGYGADWQWIEAIAPSFSLDGLTVLEFLSWVSRESGRSLRFETQSARQLAASTVLKGRVDLEPTRALRVFLQTTDLRSEIADNVITIRLAVVGN